jgi:hypothetical protein
MIIWGSKGKLKTIAEGQFYCPNCQGTRSYQRKRVAKYFTLYFIPLFQTQNLGEFIECQTCLVTFRTEVLNYSQSLEQEHEQRQKINQMIKDISNELEAGTSIQSMASAIKAAGGNEELASAAIAAATQGKIRYCKNCGSAFKAPLSFCSTCGTALSEA